MKKDLFQQQIEKWHYARRKAIYRKWNRVLPFNEAITDRWEKARYLKCGEGTSIYDSSFIFGDVKIGKGTWVGPFTILDGTGTLKIGSYCSISAGVQIYTHESVQWALTGGARPYDYAPVEIGDSCYIGPQTVISKGVKIGRHVVIGAGSFINRDIKDRSIVFGMPGKVVGQVKIGPNHRVTLNYFKKNRR